MAIEYVLGKDAKLYYSPTTVTSTSFGTAVTSSSEIDNVKDLSCDFSTDKADITTRGSGGWRSEVPTLKTGTISFGMLWKPGNAAFEDFRDAWLDNDAIFIAALDQAKSVTGAQGPAGNFSVTKFTRNENLTEALMVDVELSPSTFVDWYEVGVT